MSEGGSDTSSVQKLVESLSAIVEVLNSAPKGKGKGKGKKGQRTQNLPRKDNGRTLHRDRMRRETASCGSNQRKQEEPLRGPRERAKAKARSLLSQNHFEMR